MLGESEDNVKVVKMKLGDINIDGRYRVRDINAHMIACLVDALNAGASLPKKIVDQEGALVEGFHRYEALMKHYGAGYEVEVIKRDFDSIKARLLCAGEENQKNGLRLNPFEEKRLAFRLAKEDASLEEISSAIGRPVKKIMTWHDQAIIVTEGRKKTPKPRKGGISKEITTMTAKQYDEMEKKASGWTLVFHANQVIHHIENKTIIYDVVTVAKLNELIAKITATLKSEGVA